MIDTIITDYKFNNRITEQTILAIATEKILSQKNRTYETNIKLIKNIVKIYNSYISNNNLIKWANEDTIESYNQNDINLYPLLSPIAWFAGNDSNVENICKEVLSIFTNDLDILEFLTKITKIIFDLKRNVDKNKIREFILENKLSEEILEAYDIFMKSDSYENTFDLIDISNKDHILSAIFAYSYYKYIPNDLEQLAFNILPIGEYPLYPILVDFMTEIDYMTVITEFIDDNTKYIGYKQKANNEEFIDFYHSKNINVLKNFLLREFKNLFNFIPDDAIIPEFIESRDYIKFFKAQQYFFNPDRDIQNTLEDLITISKKLLSEITIEDLYIIIDDINKILTQLEYNEEYILFKNPGDVLSYIQRNYNKDVDVSKNLLRFYNYL